MDLKEIGRGVYGRVCKEEREGRNVLIIISKNRQTNRRNAFVYIPDHMTSTVSNSTPPRHPFLHNYEK